MKKLVGLSLLLGAICISSMSAFAGSYCEDNGIKNPQTLYAEKSKSFVNDESNNPYKHDLSTKEENFTTPDKIWAENSKKYTNDESANPYKH